MRRGFFLFFYLFGTAPWAWAIDFSWHAIEIPGADPVFDGNWSTIAHWDNGTFFPSTASDTASIAPLSPPPYTVTMDLNTHRGVVEKLIAHLGHQAIPL